MGAKPHARAILAIAPTPAHAARLTKTRVAAALRRAGRKCGIDDLAAEILHDLRAPQLRRPTPVETAMGRRALALLAMLDAATDADDLEQAAYAAFRKHPDHAITPAFPASPKAPAPECSPIGGDPTRFADDRALKASAGSAPVTRASGKVISITSRMI
ncbi:hypothetical protein J2W56_001075 [Nocardia kruczakiae]|uniref:Uncharacterized protein n=1 Tax=Nocardia kruczakiae TaxID=261477 RepID=A0ABU1XBE3_9NOCA|nr:hypothetical protein [Nocardia kruczakiae]MDR7167357.1 hypothetical protein [Nocardia kruczakiae]